MFEQDSTHIFTRRSDLIMRSYTRYFKTLEDDWIFHQRYSKEFKCKTSSWADGEHYVLIGYPHAASLFGRIEYVHAYQAAVVSKHRKAPVLVCRMSILDNQHLEKQEAVGLYWGYQGNCVCEIEFVTGEGGMFKAFGMESLRENFGCLFASDQFWGIDLSKLKPLDLVRFLGQELGIFIGGPSLSSFIQNSCTKKKEMMFGSIFLKQSII